MIVRDDPEEFWRHIMKVTCRLNGTVQIFLEPETAIERAFVETITERAEKGQSPKVSTLPTGMALTMEA